MKFVEFFLNGQLYSFKKEVFWQDEIGRLL